jgi:hypothetical protein
MYIVQYSFWLKYHLHCCTLGASQIVQFATTSNPFSEYDFTTKPTDIDKKSKENDAKDDA